MKLHSIALASGLLWGLLIIPMYEFRLTKEMYLPIFASPFIGLFIYYISRWAYTKGQVAIIVWSIVSTYIAVFLFCIFAGISRHYFNAEISLVEAVYRSSRPTLIILTFMFPFQLLFPLAYGNHMLIKNFYSKRNKAEPAGAGQPMWPARKSENHLHH